MQWLREHGVISSYQDFASLPLGVLDDARLLMEAEVRQAEQQRRRRSGRRAE